MDVPTLDLDQQYEDHREEIDAALQEVKDNTDFILGDAVEDFEQKYAEYCGVKEAIGVSSGTAALKLIYDALDIPRGSEVITSPFTFIATAEPLMHLGFEPVFADIDPRTYNLDPDAVEAAITDDTEAIVAVHLYGQPAPMGPLQELAEAHDLHLIEDAAQAHGARWRGQRVGSLGDAAAFSFYPGKNLGAYGDAGGITTDDPELAERIRKLRDHGRSEKYGHVSVGYNERMDGFQGAVLGVKLPYLDEWNQGRRENAAYYNKAFEDHSAIETPDVQDDVEHVYHQYAVRVPERDTVLNKLNEADIGASIHYPEALHLQKSMGSLNYRRGDFPEAEQAAGSVMSLPIFSGLSQEQLDYVVDQTIQAVESVETAETAAA